MTARAIECGDAPPLCTGWDLVLRDRWTGEAREILNADAQLQYRLDRTAPADVVVPLDAPGCDSLSPTKWVDELVAYRIGDTRPGSTDNLGRWVGPLANWRVDYDANQLLLTFVDRSRWPFKALATRNIVVNGTVEECWQALIDDAELSNVSGLDMSPTSPTGGTWELRVEKDSPLEPHLLALSDAALDWTVFGATALVGGTTVPTAPFATLDLAEHWETRAAVIEERGEALTTQVVVHGAGGVIGRWPANPTVGRAGSHRKSITDVTVESDIAATERAKTLYELAQATLLLYPGQGSLGRNSPITVGDLIPGRIFELADPSGVISIGQLGRLSHLSVTINDGAETAVAPTFQPPGTTGDLLVF